MQTQEDSISDGIVTPLKRVFVLGLVTWFAAAFHPIVDTLVDLLKGSHSNIDLFTGRVFPVMQALAGRTSLLYAPVLGFCLVCSAMDRSEPRKICTLGAIATFSYYAIEDAADGLGAELQNLLFLVILIPTVLKIFGLPFRRD